MYVIDSCFKSFPIESIILNFYNFVLYTGSDSTGCVYPKLPIYTEAVSTSQATSDGSIFYYKCQEGYHFNNGLQDGATQHKIQCNSGRWEPKNFYKCTGMYIYICIFI